MGGFFKATTPVLTAVSAFTIIACSSQAASQADACRLVVKHARSIIKHYDKDGDGRLNQSELRAMAADLDAMARRTNREYKAEGGEDNLQMLERRDVNRDGYVDLRELAIVPDETSGGWKSCL